MQLVKPTLRLKLLRKKIIVARKKTKCFPGTFLAGFHSCSDVLNLILESCNLYETPGRQYKKGCWCIFITIFYKTTGPTSLVAKSKLCYCIEQCCKSTCIQVNKPSKNNFFLTKNTFDEFDRICIKSGSWGPLRFGIQPIPSQ